MLDKLVESKNNSLESRKLRGLLFVTSTIAFSGVVFALIFSLFSQNLAMGKNAIELTSLITPTAIPEDKPSPPLEPKKSSAKKPAKNIKNQTPTRKQNILHLDESPQKVPGQVSTKPSTAKARPNSNFTIGVIDSEPEEFTSSNYGNKQAGEPVGRGLKDQQPKLEESVKPKIEKPVEKMPPPPKPVEKPKKPVIISQGVINGQAKNLVTPVYPAAARAAGIKGSVSVQVLIGENGKVLSANAVSGHPLLRRDSVKAARRTTFTPTLLSNQKVQVRGVIVYNFN